MIRFTRSRVLAATVSAFVALATFNCGGHNPPSIPDLPQIVVQTETEFRAALAKTYGFLTIAGQTVDAALDAEQVLVARGVVPADIDQAFKTAVRQFAIEDIKVIKAMDGHALKTWAEVKAQVDPILRQVNAIIAIATRNGPSVWSKILEGLIQVAIVLLQPGFAGGGAL